MFTRLMHAHANVHADAIAMMGQHANDHEVHNGREQYGHGWLARAGFVCMTLTVNSPVGPPIDPPPVLLDSAGEHFCRAIWRFDKPRHSAIAQATCSCRLSSKAMADFDAISTPFYIFFIYVEPLLTVLGLLYAVVLPVQYHTELIPAHLLSLLESTSEGLIGKIQHGTRSDAAAITSATFMLIHQLASCFGILACMSAIFLRMLIISLRSKAANSGKAKLATEHLLFDLLTPYFAILAVFDWVHILLTLYDLGPAARRPTEWNSLIHGNVTLVIGLFAMRTAWYLSTKASQGKNKLA
ncbi:uncharacterized protein L969DRAFT_101031 [Mixia osmundae IAM 14324]|uniref:Uncharacterized protein n=1 Tax=Mixia osmundae (strain CBS 9802 / IAM 14324 / JCM 22182 / KY 12970) TaxID=764103 RepID=G7DZF3_MIXOS|nr:uncharacterized protein L969DRAFT_101031 [Mixia osmundae IAM 14324]KEI42572.1 hypothetical protein L969DRAFT_101031 [Mixia osmundae IAM 14324]GAA95963.1 hypothetical protein E5Q_02621 [Mixia osmundae IAM 14324]